MHIVTPDLIKTSIQFSWPAFTAHVRAVRPLQPCLFTSAPAAIKALTHFSCPFFAAHHRAVLQFGAVQTVLFVCSYWLQPLIINQHNRDDHLLMPVSEQWDHLYSVCSHQLLPLSNPPHICYGPSLLLTSELFHPSHPGCPHQLLLLLKFQHICHDHSPYQRILGNPVCRSYQCGVLYENANWLKPVSFNFLICSCKYQMCFTRTTNVFIKIKNKNRRNAFHFVGSHWPLIVSKLPNISDAHI